VAAGKEQAFHAEYARFCALARQTPKEGQISSLWLRRIMAYNSMESGKFFPLLPEECFPALVILQGILFPLSRFAFGTMIARRSSTDEYA
jgi:hypothetical protein